MLGEAVNTRGIYMDSFRNPKKNLGMEIMSKSQIQGPVSIIGRLGTARFGATSNNDPSKTPMTPQPSQSTPVAPAPTEAPAQRKTFLEAMKERNKTGINFGSKR